MKAAILKRYDNQGTDLVIEDIPVPEPSASEVQFKVKTAAVNPLDNMIIRGEVKLIVPYKTPLVMGNEFCGEVTKTGADVTRFKVGDRVYGRMPLAHIGTFAEYGVADNKALAIVPNYLTDEEASTVPLTALTALQAYDLLSLKKGDSIFISGGTGSLGAMAIPIAVRMGLHVFTNGSGKNEERVKKLGVERFIDYKKEDYRNILHDVDHVLDTLGEPDLEKEFEILKKGGNLVSLRGIPNGRFARRMNMSLSKRWLFGMAGHKYDKVAAQKGQTYDFLFVHEAGDQLEKIGKMFPEERPLETAVDSIYTLEEVNAALKKVKQGGAIGKTIIRI